MGFPDPEVPRDGSLSTFPWYDMLPGLHRFAEILPDDLGRLAGHVLPKKGNRQHRRSGRDRPHVSREGTEGW